jgi:hypothetical protein
MKNVKLSISNVAEFHEIVMSEVSTRFENSNIELTMIKAAISVINRDLVDGKPFNKSVTKKFLTELDNVFGVGVCSVNYEQERFNYTIELVYKVGRIYSEYKTIKFNFSKGQDRVIDKSYILDQVTGRCESMTAYNANLESYLNQPSAVLEKMNKIANALHVLGEELADFATNYESMKYMITLDNWTQTNNGSLFLDSFFKNNR